MELFEQLMSQDRGIEQAILAAQKTISHESKDIQNKAFELYEALFIKGYGIAESQLFLQQASMDPPLQEKLELLIQKYHS